MTGAVIAAMASLIAIEVWVKAPAFNIIP